MSVHRVHLIMNWKLSWIILWYCRLEPTRAMPGFSCSDLQGRMLFRSAYDCHIAALHTRIRSRRMMWWRPPRCPRGAASSCSWCRGRCPGSSSPPSARRTHLRRFCKNTLKSDETLINVIVPVSSGSQDGLMHAGSILTCDWIQDSFVIIKLNHICGEIKACF